MGRKGVLAGVFSTKRENKETIAYAKPVFSKVVVQRGRIREVVITSVHEQDPPCGGRGGGGDYVRYHLSDEPNGQNLLT